jgi:hypothetical protein
MAVIIALSQCKICDGPEDESHAASSQTGSRLAGSSHLRMTGRRSSISAWFIGDRSKEPQTQVPVQATPVVFRTWLILGVAGLVCLFTSRAASGPNERAA